jgi:hypothetical protein
MVKKLEKGSTATSSTPQQHTTSHKNKIQEKSKIGKIKPQCRPTKHKAQESLSKKPRNSNKWTTTGPTGGALSAQVFGGERV